MNTISFGAAAPGSYKSSASTPLELPVYRSPSFVHAMLEAFATIGRAAVVTTSAPETAPASPTQILTRD